MNVLFFVWCLFLSVVLAVPAFAYLDPGTGSMILQAVGAVLVTCLVFFQGLRQRIKSFFMRGKKNGDKTEANKPNTEKTEEQ